MEVVAFTMRLKPGHKELYKQRHDEIWPELVWLLKGYGISEYRIFLDERTNVLFAVQTRSLQEPSQKLGAQEIMQKWWDHMADIMEVNPDNSPVTERLEPVFYMQ